MDTNLQEFPTRVTAQYGQSQEDTLARPTPNSSTAELQISSHPCFHSIEDVDRLAPFFMSMISSDDHWMFISSSGALTCGRKCADQALFPYYSSDKLLDTVTTTGPMTIIQLKSDSRVLNWKPWLGEDSAFSVHRSLHKSQLGNRICFEETNTTLQLLFRYQWALSKKLGFVRQVELVNLGDQKRHIRILDGLQNVLPSGLDHHFQLRYSNLADAYKKSELHGQDNIGVFYLSSVPTDRAEPSEGLRATVVWHDISLPCRVLLSDRQLKNFSAGLDIQTEIDICGQRGCFLTEQQIELEPRGSASWNIVSDVHVDHDGLARLEQELKRKSCKRLLLNTELAAHDTSLIELASKVDGIQVCRNSRRAARHLTNCFFNAMRGGVPFAGYRIHTKALIAHLQKLNRDTAARQSAWLQSLPAVIDYPALLELVRSMDDADLRRICEEYLPLSFSRRHGDPTRPWNSFNIDLKNPDGSLKLAYEGNWRDIFQNWEALATSYPLYLPAMVKRFVNASTIDGYNPYRINQDGFDWERLDSSDPWANIGYWGDHQIVYLSKLLEKSLQYCPKALSDDLTLETCVYASVPYRIRDYAAIRENPRATIDYDRKIEQEITDRKWHIGSDGQLVVDQRGNLHRVNLLEKLLLPAAVKMTNWIPEAGIWLNTQRPEWNDAQNALVGFGASVVTVCHLRGYLVLLRRWLVGWSADLPATKIIFTQEVAELLSELRKCLLTIAEFQGDSVEQIRHCIVERLQEIGQRYRRKAYSGLSGNRAALALAELMETIELSVAALESTIRANRRPDGLYHSYNLLSFGNDSIGIEYLDEMLEGQVAVIESGYLTSAEIVDLLNSLRSSRLYRDDQQSYLLYPNRRLLRFDQRNRIDKQQAESLELDRRLNELPGSRLIYRDASGQWRFSADLRNANDLRSRLEQLADCNELKNLIASEGHRLLELYEQTFRHRHFTGRANTFFAYEGLGSIYWHMVSKLALATCRASILAHNQKSELAEQIRGQFRSINNGIWLRKSPAVYGAFPTDPYSHTPLHGGAQQPGMTGQVKEDILIRQLELGVRVEGGALKFDPWLLDDSELLSASSTMEFVDVLGVHRVISLAPGCLGFTICQVPVILRKAQASHARIYMSDDRIVDRPILELSQDESQSLFSRQGRILKIEIDWAVR